MSIRIVSSSLAVVVGVLLAASPALAATYHLFGDAEIVSPGHDSAHAVEADGTTTGSGVVFDIPEGTTFADLDKLSTDYLFTSTATCTAGSPRFQVRVEVPSVGPRTSSCTSARRRAIRPAPPPDWVNTGDLLEGVNPIDTSQLPAGTFYDPYTTALTKYGGYVVTRVSLVVDPGYSQVVRFDNTVVDQKLYTYAQPATKDECKSNGWKDLIREDGSTFKNQGDCIQYVNTGK